MNSTNLNNDQRQLINMYINQYNQANSQIDRLYTVLNEIRFNINRIVYSNTNTNTNTNTCSNTSNSTNTTSSMNSPSTSSDPQYQ